MIHFLLGTLVLLVPGTWALPRARLEMVTAGGVSRPTVVAALVAFTGHWVVTALASIRGIWPIPIPAGQAVAAGVIIAAAGAAVYLAGRLQFRSFRLT